MRCFKKLKGDRLYLSPVNVDNTDLFIKWTNDKDVCEHQTQNTIVFDIADEKKYLDKLSTEGYNFAIVLNDTEESVGSIGLLRYKEKDKTAEIGLFIGPVDKKGKGYGPEALKILLKYLFKSLNIQNISLQVYDFNSKAIKAYKKLGFRELGRKIKAKYCNGSYHDVIFMELLNNI